VVEQAAGGRDEDLDAAEQLLRLRLDRHAAEGDRRAERKVAAVRLDRIGDLDGELAGRGHDQGPDRVAGRREARVRVGLEPLEDREDERGGLAGARLGGGDDVAAAEDDGDCRRLDRSGLAIALVGHRSQELGREAERVEAVRQALFFAFVRPGISAPRRASSRGPIPRAIGRCALGLLRGLNARGAPSDRSGRKG